MPPELIDIGVNLAHRSFDADRDAVIARARAAGVGRMFVTGTSVASSRAALALARAYPEVLAATAGVHPHEARHFDARAEAELEALGHAPEIAALGECGLDFERHFSPPEAQERAFAAQLALAARVGKPVFLHERRAHARFVALLGAERARLRAAVVHCFTGTDAELDAYLALDCHIGITGFVCDERRGQHLAALVARIPDDRLMLETDAPFLLPRNMAPRPAGRRNEPAFLPYVLAVVARAKGLTPEEVAARTSATARAFFGKEREK